MFKPVWQTSGETYIASKEELAGMSERDKLEYELFFAPARPATLRQELHLYAQQETGVQEPKVNILSAQRRPCRPTI